MFTHRSTRSSRIYKVTLKINEFLPRKWITMKFRTKERTNERKKKPGKILSSCSEFVEMNKWREREKKCRMQTKRIDGEQQRQNNVWQHYKCCCFTYDATIICIISHILIHLCNVILSPLIRFFFFVNFFLSLFLSFFFSCYIHHHRHNTYTKHWKKRYSVCMALLLT